jgi:WD40 repeat protein
MNSRYLATCCLVTIILASLGCLPGGSRYLKKVVLNKEIGVSALQWESCGNHMFAGREDGSVDAFETADSWSSTISISHVKTIKVFSSRIAHISASRCGSVVVAGDRETSVGIIEYGNGDFILSKFNYTSFDELADEDSRYVTYGCLSDDGSTLALATKNNYSIIDVATRQVVKVLKKKFGSNWQDAYLGGGGLFCEFLDKEHIIIGDTVEAASLWDIEKGQIIKSWENILYDKTLVYDRTMSELIVLGADKEGDRNKILIINAQDGTYRFDKLAFSSLSMFKEEFPEYAHRCNESISSYKRSLNLIATSDWYVGFGENSMVYNAHCCLINLDSRTLSQIKKEKGHYCVNHPCNVCLPLPSLVWHDFYGPKQYYPILVCDPYNGKNKHLLFAGHDKPLTSLAFHPSKNILASAGADGRIYFWDLKE